MHKVFGTSNVAKLLNEHATNVREYTGNSLAYEAEACLRDPIYGCVDLISVFQNRLKKVQSDLYSSKKEVATYIGPQAMIPVLQAQAFMPQHLGNPSSSTVIQHGMVTMMMICDPQNQHHHQQQMFEAQQLAAAVAARERQEMLRSYEQQQQEFVRFNNGFNVPTGFNQMSGAAMSPSLALRGSDNAYQIQAQQQPEHHHQAQILLDTTRTNTTTTTTTATATISNATAAKIWVGVLVAHLVDVLRLF